MTEPTKACVRVLRIENKFLRFVKWVVNFPIKILIFVFNLIDKLLQYINWCIVRAITRWVGFPLTGYVLYYFVIRIVETNGTLEVMSFPEFFVYIMLISVLGGGGIMSWLEIPDKEKNILYEGLQ